MHNFGRYVRICVRPRRLKGLTGPENYAFMDQREYRAVLTPSLMVFLLLFGSGFSPQGLGTHKATFKAVMIAVDISVKHVLRVLE